MDFAGRLIDKYAKNFDSIEIQLSEGSSKTVDTRDGEVEDVAVNSSSGLKIRVFKEGRILYYTSGGVNEERLDAFFREAQDVINLTEKDENVFIPSSPETYEYVTDLAEPDIEKLKSFALVTESGAKGLDARVKSVKSASCSYINQKTLITGTHIAAKVWNRQLISSFCQCLAEDNGDIQEGYEGETVYFGKPFTPVLTGKKAAETAVSLLGGKPLKTGKYNILFDSGTAAQFFELISEMCDAENILKHMSLFEGRLGQAVASSVLSIWDDPFHPDAIGSYRFDDEGTAAVKTHLVTKGDLESYLHNGYTAGLMKTANTANAVRTGSGKIGIGASNLVIGSTEKASAITAVQGDVVKVLDVMGLHTADTVSGDFSLGISGVVLRNGEPVSSFRESVLTGNLMDLLKAVTAVYDNTRIHGNVVTGDVLFDKLTISGS
ncbi:TldD/PmbA family protein [Geovibrio thiophilus]|uniref:TldD/PmbA family protein n=1 Tax=Geovibrio thiophilus TaxID=139438 RepID=A0A3R5XX12_9BACT|nr:TldD/PmbA family protein [Geovibrio thiophilus]QAR33301.1 TldD/PmbA family protein [Geovibrio thiophilus]